jgi:hypothetical protein
MGVKTMEKQTKIAAVLASVALIAGGLSGAAIAVQTIEPIEVPVIVNNTVYEILPVPTDVVVEKEVIVTQNITVEDTEFLKLACDRLLYDDLIDCKKEIVAEDKALQIALDEIKSDFAREAERYGLIVDDRKAELISIYTDFDELEVVSSNFNRNKYEFDITTRVYDERADARYDIIYTVKVDNGVAKIVNAQYE